MNGPREPDDFKNLLAFALIGAFISFIPLFVFKSIPSANEQIIVYMVGQLSGMATTALGAYFITRMGQDRIDAQRADTTAKAFDAVTATAQAASGAPAVAQAADAVAEAASDKADQIKGGRE